MNLQKVGHVKFRLERLANYAGRITQLMVVWLYFDRAGWSWWWLLAIPGLWAVHEFDKRLALPAESSAQTRSNEIVMDIHRMVKELHDRAPHA